MPSNNQALPQCFFCQGQIKLRHPGVFHTFNSDHGPFDIYACTNCGSCQTHPLPSVESLTSLYGSYDDGLPDLHRRITADDPQNALYGKCINRFHRLSKRNTTDEFTWIDVGAGGGELSLQMAKKFPNSHGTAIDLHTRPESLNNVPSVTWQQVDINAKQFCNGLPQFDLVISIAVWEHVLRPDLFVANLLQMVRPGGMLYLLCPNNGSWASRLLGRRWPYFTPGEHISIPTPRGATLCLQRELSSLFGKKEHGTISSKPVMLPYTFRYVLRRLGIDAIGKLLPSGWGIPLPSGALEAVVVWQPKKEVNLSFN